MYNIICVIVWKFGDFVTYLLKVFYINGKVKLYSQHLSAICRQHVWNVSVSPSSFSLAEDGEWWQNLF